MPICTVVTVGLAWQRHIGSQLVCQDPSGLVQEADAFIHVWG